MTDPHDLRLDKEAKSRRKKDIKEISTTTKTIFEHALNVYNISGNSSNAGLLSELRNIDKLRANADDSATIGELAVAYLEDRLAILKARLTQK